MMSENAVDRAKVLDAYAQDTHRQLRRGARGIEKVKLLIESGIDHFYKSSGTIFRDAYAIHSMEKEGASVIGIEKRRGRRKVITAESLSDYTSALSAQEKLRELNAEIQRARSMRWRRAERGKERSIRDIKKERRAVVNDILTHDWHKVRVKQTLEAKVQTHIASIQTRQSFLPGIQKILSHADMDTVITSDRILMTRLQSMQLASVNEKGIPQLTPHAQEMFHLARTYVKTHHLQAEKLTPEDIITLFSQVEAVFSVHAHRSRLEERVTHALKKGDMQALHRYIREGDIRAAIRGTLLVGTGVIVGTLAHPVIAAAGTWGWLASGIASLTVRSTAGFAYRKDKKSTESSLGYRLSLEKQDRRAEVQKQFEEKGKKYAHTQTILGALTMVGTGIGVHEGLSWLLHTQNATHISLPSQSGVRHDLLSEAEGKIPSWDDTLHPQTMSLLNGKSLTFEVPQNLELRQAPHGIYEIWNTHIQKKMGFIRVSELTTPQSLSHIPVHVEGIREKVVYVDTFHEKVPTASLLQSLDQKTIIDQWDVSHQLDLDDSIIRLNGHHAYELLWRGPEPQTLMFTTDSGEHILLSIPSSLLHPMSDGRYHIVFDPEDHTTALPFFVQGTTVFHTPAEFMQMYAHDIYPDGYMHSQFSGGFGSFQQVSIGSATVHPDGSATFTHFATLTNEKSIELPPHVTLEDVGPAIHTTPLTMNTLDHLSTEYVENTTVPPVDIPPALSDDADTFYRWIDHELSWRILAMGIPLGAALGVVDEQFIHPLPESPSKKAGRVGEFMGLAVESILTNVVGVGVGFLGVKYLTRQWKKNQARKQIVHPPSRPHPPLRPTILLTPDTEPTIHVPQVSREEQVRMLFMKMYPGSMRNVEFYNRTIHTSVWGGYSEAFRQSVLRDVALFEKFMHDNGGTSTGSWV